jgi:hypothetical protein
MPCVAAPSHRRGPARSRSRTHPCRLVALTQLCTPARVRPNQRGPAGPLVLFPLRRTSPQRCAPARRAGMALPWRTALHTRLQGSGAPSSGCLVHVSPPALAHTRTRPCLATSSMSAAAFLRRPELRRELRCPAALRPTQGPSPSRSHLHACVHPSARTFAPNTGARPRCRVPTPCRRHRANHGADLAAPVASFLVRLLQALAIQGDPVKLTMGHDAQAPRDLTGGKAISCRRSLGT